MGELNIKKIDLTELAYSSGVQSTETKEAASIFLNGEISGNEDSFESGGEPTYKKVYDVVLTRTLKSRGYDKLGDIKNENVRNKILEKAKQETERVINLCRKYNMESLAPVIAHRLGCETGGYVYVGEPRPGRRPKTTLHSDSGKYYGAMQTNDLILKCIYCDKNNIKDKNIKNDYDKYFSQDKKFIDKITQRYGTIQDLKNAMAKDVSLGLEIGILAFRAKLREKNFNVNEAHKKYCGKDIPSSVPHPTKFNL